MTKALQQQFIFSLRILDLYHKNKDLQEVVKFLEQPNIKINDYGDEKKLLLFIMVLVNKYPEVLHDSHDKPLREFVSSVLNHLKHSPSELKPKKPSSGF